MESKLIRLCSLVMNAMKMSAKLGEVSIILFKLMWYQETAAEEWLLPVSDLSCLKKILPSCAMRMSAANLCQVYMQISVQNFRWAYWNLSCCVHIMFHGLSTEVCPSFEGSSYLYTWSPAFFTHYKFSLWELENPNELWGMLYSF